MSENKTSQTISWGVYINDHGNKKIIPCETEQEAKNLVAKYTNDTPLFGEAVTAVLVKRLKTVKISYSDWKKA